MIPSSFENEQDSETKRNIIRYFMVLKSVLHSWFQIGRNVVPRNGSVQSPSSVSLLVNCVLRPQTVHRGRMKAPPVVSVTTPDHPTHTITIVSVYCKPYPYEISANTPKYLHTLTIVSVYCKPHVVSAMYYTNIYTHRVAISPVHCTLPVVESGWWMWLKTREGYAKTIARMYTS